MTQFSDYGIEDLKLRLDFTVFLSSNLHQIHLQGTFSYGYMLLFAKDVHYRLQHSVMWDKFTFFNPSENLLYSFSESVICSLAV